VGGVRFTADQALRQGSDAALAHALGRCGTPAAAGMPGFVPGWLLLA